MALMILEYVSMRLRLSELLRLSLKVKELSSGKGVIPETSQ